MIEILFEAGNRVHKHEYPSGCSWVHGTSGTIVRDADNKLVANYMRDRVICIRKKP